MVNVQEVELRILNELERRVKKGVSYEDAVAEMEAEIVQKHK